MANVLSEILIPTEADVINEPTIIAPGGVALFSATEDFSDTGWGTNSLGPTIETEPFTDNAWGTNSVSAPTFTEPFTALDWVP